MMPELSIGKRLSGAFRKAWGILALVLPLASPAPGADAAQAENISFYVENGIVYVTYDLNGDRNREYAVSLLLKRETIPDFSYRIPTAVGDFGVGKFAGANREMKFSRLAIEGHLPEDAEDIYFVVVVEEIPGEIRNDSRKVLKWGLLLAGAGGAAYYGFSLFPEKPQPITMLPPDRP